MSTNDQPRNIRWEFPALALHNSSKASVNPVESDIREETRVAPHRPGTSKRRLQPPREPSTGARDAVPRTISPTRPNGPDADGASRIGVDTDQNHFSYTRGGGGYGRYGTGGGLFDDYSTHRVDRQTE